MLTAADQASIPFIDRYKVLKPFSLLFKDSALEQQYIAGYATKVAGQARLALILAFVLYTNFALLDYLLVPESMYQLWSIRAVTCCVFVLAFALTYKSVFKNHNQKFLILCGLTTAAGVFCMLMITHNNVNHFYYEGLNLCITWTLFIIGLRFINALKTVLVIIAIYNAIAFYKEIMLTEIISNNFFLMSNAIIGIFAGYTIEQHARWQFYQAMVIHNNSKRLHQAMLEASHESVITVDDHGIVMEFNQAAESVFGYSRQDAIGKPMSELILPEPERAQNQAAFLRFVASDVKKHQTYRKEMEVMRRDGSVFPVEITLREVDLIGQRLVTAYFRDLTAQRNADQEIMRQREILQRNEKLSALGALLAGVAHELNNPLSVVVGQAQLLRETEQEPRVLKRAEKIAHAADRCAKVVSTFLSMARQKPPQRTLVNLNEVVEDALSLLEYGLRSRGISLSVELQPGLPLLHADSDQLHQVVTNLVINAQHALQDVGCRELKIGTCSLSDGVVQLSVADSGPGVPEDIRHRIFEPFFTTKSMGVGTGLGLSVCNGIVEAHGGSLSLSDAKGGGACFTVTLVPETGVEDSAKEPPTVTAISRSLTIAVVDDEPEILELVNENLKAAGHTVLSTSSGTELLSIINDHSPDIILSDFRMPVMSGPDIFAAATQRWPALAERFIFMTGDVLTTDSASFLQELELPVLEKPFTAEQLHNSIYNTLHSIKSL